MSKDKKQELRASGVQFAEGRKKVKASKIRKPMSAQKTSSLKGTWMNDGNPNMGTRVAACIAWHGRDDRLDQDGEPLVAQTITREDALDFLQAFDMELAEA